MNVRLVVLVVGWGALVGACSDSRCSLEKCTTLINECRVEYAASPRARACFRIDGGVPAGFDFFRYCSPACNAQASGALTQCLIDHRTTCADGGVEQALLVCADPTAKISEASCSAACDTERTACEARCPTTTFASCYDCSATCGLTWASCDGKCPRQ